MTAKEIVDEMEAILKGKISGATDPAVIAANYCECGILAEECSSWNQGVAGHGYSTTQKESAPQERSSTLTPVTVNGVTMDTDERTIATGISEPSIPELARCSECGRMFEIGCRNDVCIDCLHEQGGAN